MSPSWGLGWLRLVAPCCSLAAALCGAAAWADGRLPAQQYHWLHPPPALAATNLLPTSGTRSFPARIVRSASWFAFTQDAQAGISAPAGAFALPLGAVLRIDLHPVETPPGLPATVQSDGNAYRITAHIRPGARLAVPGKPLIVVLRWPHRPRGIYRFAAGHWQQVCGYAAAFRTPETFSCSTRRLGIFVAVIAGHPKPVAGKPEPAPGRSRWWPVFLIGLISVLVLIGIWALRRSMSADRLSE